MNRSHPTNRLAAETSPYLLQHADNPVDWYPWGEEAFGLARERGKPVLLSVGYSACHWCHVMAHESFEDEPTAELMNRLFVNIKVDREERPDVDKIYQTAHQLLTQRGGGWPLTMFLNPEDQRPFFGGTYFPNEARYGMPAFSDLLLKVAAYYDEHRDEIRDQGERLTDVLGKLEPPAADESASLNSAPLTRVRQQLASSFDKDYGGFGGAPKFPHPTTIDRLLRTWRSSSDDAEPDVEALYMASLTLMRMAEGGIYDHLGGGFCRYSVDQYWQIPHFEKMLYDNGPLLALYAQAHLATGEQAFAAIADETAGWMLAEMRDDNGGFYSSFDADSEGEEGKFYVWTPDEVSGLLDAGDYEAFARRYGLDKAPNFEGKWHLSIREDVDDAADAIARARNTLLAARSKRIAPGRDDKQLTSWNALAIRGLAIAGRTLSRDDLTRAASDAAKFVHDHLFVDGRLFASYKDGRARFPAYLDDHAFMVDALLELLQSHWERPHLDFAIELAELLLGHFEDNRGGGFFFTADDHEQLMHRSRPLADEAIPSGNGVAAFALQRLGHLIGEKRFIDAAERTLRAAWRAMDEYPHGHVSLLTALEEFVAPPEIMVLRGMADEITDWRDTLARLYTPARLVIAIPGDEKDLPGLLAEQSATGEDAIAYRCVGRQCELISR